MAFMVVQNFARVLDRAEVLRSVEGDAAAFNLVAQISFLLAQFFFERGDLAQQLAGMVVHGNPCAE